MRLRDNEDPYRYYDKNEGSDLTECDEDTKDDSSAYSKDESVNFRKDSEDERRAFLNDNEDSSSHNEDEDRDFSHDHKGIWNEDGAQPER